MDMEVNAVGDELRKVEEELFFNFVKKEVIAEQGAWVGSVGNNRLADIKVSGIVKSAFKNYEKTRQKSDPQYFVFKK